MNKRVLDELGSNIDAKASEPVVKTVVKPKMVRIVLEENDNIPPCGQFVCLNGATWMIRPGYEVNVPVGVTEILDNAVEMRAVINPQTRQCIGWTKRLRYPYRRVAGERELAARAEDQAAA